MVFPLYAEVLFMGLSYDYILQCSHF